MVISDKQTLRRCVKQAVRRTEVVETLLYFDICNGGMGIKTLAETFSQSEESTPFQANAVAAYAAMEALDMPIDDMHRAALIQSGYTREAYLREILDVMHARRVFACVSLREAEHAAFADDRVAPLLVISSDLFTPGRYGVEYAERADEIRSAAQKCGAKDILMEHFDENALQFCLLPLCEDEKLRLHIQLENGRQLNAFILLLDLFVGVRALAFADASIEPALIEAAASRRRLLVRIGEHIPLALSRLGTRFIPYASEAILPEQMLGRWIVAREAIWPVLCDAYLPLARCGYPLTSEAIAADVQKLFGGHFLMDDDTAQNARE